MLFFLPFVLAAGLCYLCLGRATRALLLDKVGPLYRLSGDLAEIGTRDIITLLFCILKKYIVRPDLHYDCARQCFILPRIAVEATLCVDNDVLRKYDRAVPQHSGLATRMVWAAVTTPLVLVILAHPNCPIMPLGAVNVSNTFSWDEKLADSVYGEEVNVEAQFGGAGMEGRRVKSGLEFDVHIRVLHHGRLVFTQEVRLLQFLQRHRYPAETAQAVQQANTCSGESRSLVLTYEIPKTWAQVCKDYNPIHHSGLAAKALGFPNKIAHGNHVLALALRQSGLDGTKVSVAFKRPCVLPASDLSVIVNPQTGRICVSRGGKILVEVDVTK
ncbi:hypothetical protein PYCC9005_004413 [Savitreella phatthalungensis]